MPHTQPYREVHGALDDIHGYFDLAWEIFTRLEREEPEKFDALIKELHTKMRPITNDSIPTEQSKSSTTPAPKLSSGMQN